ncbi:MAG: PilZ domain-containing protein [Novosphingobium sp.]|uniref:PilZ domain-containing protein n=1 Tax=Novosphingobium sp. TaxID=1874826 RepID=UPI003C7CDE9A
MIERPITQANAVRRTDRKPFAATVQFRAGNRRADVRVSDISALGARIAGVFLVREGDHFFLKIGHLGPIEARVIWVNDFDFGCEFLQPLSEVVYDALTNERI